MNVTGLQQGPPPLPSPPRRKLRRALIAAAAGLSLAAIGLVAHFATKKDGTTPAQQSAEAARQEARQALAAFLAATTPEARAAKVIAGDQLLPLMQAWYATHEVEPLPADGFREPGWTFGTPAADLTALEYPRGRGLPPVVACFKKSDTGAWLLDWEIWTQTFDGQFRNFINRPAEGEHTLRARLTRSQSSGAMNITVTDPFDGTQTMTFDVGREDLQALYARDLPETGGRTATVQVVWLNDPLSGTLRAALRRHICWGFPGLDGKQAEEVVVNMRSKHRPPPGKPAVPPPALASTAAPVIKDAVETAVAPATSGSLTTRVNEAGDTIQTAQK